MIQQIGDGALLTNCFFRFLDQSLLIFFVQNFYALQYDEAHCATDRHGRCQAAQSVFLFRAAMRCMLAKQDCCRGLCQLFRLLIALVLYIGHYRSMHCSSLCVMTACIIAVKIWFTLQQSCIPVDLTQALWLCLNLCNDNLRRQMECMQVEL